MPESAARRPGGPVDDVGGQQRQPVAEPGDLAHVPLGRGGVGAQPGDELRRLLAAWPSGPGGISRSAVRRANSQSTGRPG